jgi:uncharacterized protein YukE
MARMGMDVDLVEEKGRGLKADAEKLDQIIRQLDAVVRRLPASWEGQDARDFVNSRWPRHKQSLQQSVAAVRGLGESAINNAADQRRTSADQGAQPGDYSQDARSHAWLQSLPATHEGWQDSMKRANPHYGDFSQDVASFYASLGLLDSSGEFRNNCGYAAIAYEMRRRGFDVTAAPDLDGDTTTDIASTFHDPQTGEPRSWTMSDGKAGIADSMQDFGPGSRAIVMVRWKGNTGGHFFNVENIDGQVVYLDAQSNQVNVDDYFNRIEPGTARFMRTDDLEPEMNPMRYTMVETNDQ